MSAFSLLRVPIGNTSRANGQEIGLHGRGLRVLSEPPPGAAVSFDGHGGSRIPIHTNDVFWVDFDSLWLFHEGADSINSVVTLEPLVLMAFAGSAWAENAGRVDDELAVYQQLDKTTTGLSTLAGPFPGEQIRIRGYRFELSANVTLAAAGLLEVALQSTTYPPNIDGTVDSHGEGWMKGTRHNFYLPAAVPAGALGSIDSGWVELPGRGIITRPGATLSVRLSAALATGKLVTSVRYSRVVH